MPATLAPSDTSRCASASVCAHTAASAEYAGRASHAKALGRGQRFVVEPRIGQHQRNAALGTGGGQLGPDLGFHEDADARLGSLFQKARARRLGRVPRLPDLLDRSGPSRLARLRRGRWRCRCVSRIANAPGPAWRSAAIRMPAAARVSPSETAWIHTQPWCLASGRFVVVAEALFHRDGVAGLGHRRSGRGACGATMRLQQPVVAAPYRRSSR
jgi:hypothetical protein